MRNWVLTTSIRYSPDFYTDHILPITGPLFAAYADTWEMTYDPHMVSDAALSEFVGHIPTTGTEPVYASIPHRRRLLDSFDGVVYFDEDAVILRGDRDICLEVSDEKPIGMMDGLCGALQVLKSTPETKEFLDLVWDLRHAFKRIQWAEEGAMKHLLGWDHVYENNRKRSAFLGETEWTSRLNLLPFSLLHPLDEEAADGPWFAMNPGGIWPRERRLEIIKQYAAMSTVSDRS